MHARIAVSMLVLGLASGAFAQTGEPASAAEPAKKPSNSRTGFERPYAEGRNDSSFMFCTLQYSPNGWEEPLGFGWSTDYPDSGYRLMEAIAEKTSIEIARQPNGEPEPTTIRIMDPGLKDFPYIFASDVGTAALSDEEEGRLRDYLLEGGFLHVDDFWGKQAWKNWASEIARVLPPDEYPIRDVPLSHEIFHKPFEVGKIPQIPSVQFWAAQGRGSDRGTSERGRETATPHLRGIWDKKGRLMVVMSHNTDLADSWEVTAEKSAEYYRRFSERGGIPLGINIVSYALTH